MTFARPFCLGGFDEALPAGTYDVETDEELLEGISFPVYRRIATLLRLHAAPADRGRTRTFTVDPRELDAALERDGAPGDDRTPEADRPEPEAKPGRVLARDKTGVQDMQSSDSALSRQDISPEAAEEMTAYGITRVLVEEFHYRGFRYANLRDAVSQAKRQQRLG